MTVHDCIYPGGDRLYYTADLRPSLSPEELMAEVYRVV